MSVAGSVGIGFVWGWLLILFWRDGSGKRPLRYFTASLFSTILASGMFIWLTDSNHLLVFGGTAVIALTLHLAWRTRLRQQAENKI